MIPLLFGWISQTFHLHIPLFFEYYSTRILLATLTSLVFSILCGPSFIRKLYEMKIGQPVRKEDCPLLGQLHSKKENTPTMGGILILTSMLISLLLWMDPTHIFTLILFITTIVLGFLGGWDDYLKLKYRNSAGLSARKKMSGQIFLAGIITIYLISPSLQSTLHFKALDTEWFAAPTITERTPPAQNVSTISLEEYASRLYIPFFKEPVFTANGWLGWSLIALLFIFVITGSSNATNLTDGLDGLAAGCLVMVGGTLAGIAFLMNHSGLAHYLNIPYVEGSGEIAIYLCSMVGATLGFLWYNCHPAQLFMGDVGSLSLGGILGVSAVLLRKEGLLAISGGIFVAEALSVIIRVCSYRWRGGKRIFLCSPLHHHYEYKGWPETKIVIRFWIISLLCSLFGLLSLKLQ